MKTKNAILGLLAIVFAVGSAFTTGSPPLQPVKVEVQFTSGGPWTCYNVDLECENGGNKICKISVPIQGGTKTVDGKDINSCLIISYDNDTPRTATYVPSPPALPIDAR